MRWNISVEVNFRLTSHYALLKFFLEKYKGRDANKQPKKIHWDRPLHFLLYKFNFYTFSV